MYFNASLFEHQNEMTLSFSMGKQLCHECEPSLCKHVYRAHDLGCIKAWVQNLMEIGTKNLVYMVFSLLT